MEDGDINENTKRKMKETCGGV
jgi:hypothetical protein